MMLVHHPLAPDALSSAPDHTIPIRVERRTLQKRRFRAAADDGLEFGFDLSQPLSNGAVVHVEAHTAYVIRQTEELVLELELPRDPCAAARLAWQLGNLHQPIEILDNTIRLADEPGVAHQLGHLHLSVQRATALFCPMTAQPHGHAHGHGHAH